MTFNYFKLFVIAYALISSIIFVEAQSCSSAGQKCYSNAECCGTLLCPSFLKKCVTSGIIDRLLPPPVCTKDGSECKNSKDCCTKFCSTIGICGKDADEEGCKPIGGLCHTAEDCCSSRCHSFLAKCVT